MTSVTEKLTHLSREDFTWQQHSPLFIPWLLLVALGWLMVASASTGIAEYYTGNAFYFSARHAVYAVMGVITTFLISQVPMATWQRFDFWLLMLGIVGLVLVFVPGIGHEVNGSQRWLNFGFVKVQASEIAKLGAVFYLSGYLVRRQIEVQSSWLGFLKPFVILVVMVGLLLLEPDFGAVVVLMGSAMILLFLGGVKVGQYFLLLSGALFLSYLILTAESYRVERLMAYMDPWAPEYVYGSGYQLTQSLIAFGRGEWFGIGLGESIQKLFYLPEAHTDFVFAIWAEETGLVGALSALALMLGAIGVIWLIAYRARRMGHFYSAFVAIGIASLLGLQVLINLGVNTGLLPTKGLTLPFYSYGGSSLLICCAMVGIVLRIDYEAYLAGQEDQSLDSIPEKTSKAAAGEVIHG